ncbi:MAG: DUF4468 domain-containing protein [Bacteroidales bacterium]|nr:DUF4468 domain-containing protein [Bacteroidales bacterium]
MRFSILLLVFISGLEIYGQSDSIERVILLEKQQSREISKVDYSYTLKKWNVAIEKDKYPDLPVNEIGQLQYSYIAEFQGMSKEKIFNRILEWFSITYGIIPAYLYSNLADGKIISSNSIKVNDNTSGNYTYILTIIDEKLLIEFANIGYQIVSGGYYSNNTWIPEKTNSYKIDQVFPVILKDPERWAFYLKLLNTLDKHIKSDIDSLNDYVINYDLRYSF